MLVFLILASGVIPSSANDSVSISGDSSYVFAKGTVNALGVTFVSEDNSPITRGEFVSALVSLSGMKGVTSGEIPYEDITTESPYYNSINTAYTLSWISESLKFNPDQSITLVQALKMGIHAIGGERQARYYGGYPTGYVHLGNSLDFTENLSSVDDKPLTIYDAYILLYNIISSKTFVTGFEGDGNVSVSFGDSSILEKHHNMYVTEGILTANSVTNLYDETDVGRTTLKVGNEEFVDENGMYEYLGYNVKLLYKKNGSKKHAKFVCPFDTNYITINNKDISKVEENVVYYGENEKRLSLNPALIYVLNGKRTFLPAGELSTILSDKSSVFTLIDNNNDRKYDILSVLKYTYTFVNKYDLFDGIIYDMHSETSLIDLSKEECKYTVISFEDGEYKPASITDVSANSLIACAISSDKTYANIVLCKDKVTGVISEVTSEGEFIIDDTEYDTSTYFSNYYTIKLGEEATYYLGINGEIVCESDEKNLSKYAYIIDVAKENSLNGEILVKIFDQSDEILIVGVEDVVRVDGIKNTDDEFYTFVSSLNDTESRLICYTLSKNGKINMIDTMENKVNDFNSYGLDMANDNTHAIHFAGNFYARGSKIFVNEQGLGKFNYGNTEHIFVVPDESQRNDEKLYRIANASEITAGADYILDLYAYNADTTGSPQALLVVGGYLHSADSVVFAKAYGVVTQVNDAVNEDGEKCYKLYIANSSGYNTLYLSTEVAAKYFIPGNGDIVSYATDINGNIKFLIKAFDLLTYTIGTNYSVEASQLAFTCGYVYSANGGYVHYIPAQMQSEYLAVCPDSVNFEQLRNVNVSNSKTVYVDVVRSTDGSEIKSVCVNSNPDTKLKDAKTSGNKNASFIVNRLNYSSNLETYIFNTIYK